MPRHSRASLGAAAGALVVLLCSAAMHAATISVTADQEVYSVGDTITLSFVGAAEGGPAAHFFYVELLFDDSLVAWTGTDQTQATSDGFPWLIGGATTNCNFGITPGLCPVFDQIWPLPDQTAVPDGLLYSTLTFEALAGGVVDFDIATGNRLHFFGLESVDGVSVTIDGPPPVAPPPPPVVPPPPPVVPPPPPSGGGDPGPSVPEPSSALVFAAGLWLVSRRVRAGPRRRAAA